MTKLGSIIEYIDTSWQNDVKQRISKQLEQRSEVDEIEFGQLLADALSDCAGQFVFVQGRFWCFSAKTGLYEPIDDVELRNLLYELHNSNGHDRRRHQLTKPKIGRIVSIAADRLTDNLFFDDAQQGLATADGFLLLTNGKAELKNHNPNYRARWNTPIFFNPLSKTEPTARELEKILGNAENVQTFLEILGAALFGLGSHFGRLLVLVGDGANGKSALLEIISHMIPANMRASVPLDALKTEYDRVQLSGKILNTNEELPSLSRTDVQLIKNISTGGEIQARQIGQSAFTMRPIAQHIICTNHLPVLHENNEALQRRLIVIRLEKIIPENERDPDFAKKFFSENKEALLILAVRAIVEATQRKRIFEPEASKREVTKWLNNSDCIRSFLRECVEQTGNPKDRIPVEAMYDACVCYAQTHHTTPPSSPREFGSRLEAAGLARKKFSTMYWVGVRLQANSWEERED